MRSRKTLFCVRCDGSMENVNTAGNQPMGGLAFVSHGHYGSTVFDPMNGDYLELNICDACLESAAEVGDIVHHTPSGKSKLWRGK